MLNVGLIQPSHIPFSSTVLFVKKMDGSWHYCVDYRALNAITVKDCFSMSTIDELLDKLGHASWFSKLDLCQGFHQIQMAEEDIPKTVFQTHHDHYEFKVMPFGLCNAPSTFQATMNDAFCPFLCKFVVVFLTTYWYTVLPFQRTWNTWNLSSLRYLGVNFSCAGLSASSHKTSFNT